MSSPGLVTTFMAALPGFDWSNTELLILLRPGELSRSKTAGCRWYPEVLCGLQGTVVT
jgi:hypothetical protein